MAFNYKSVKSHVECLLRQRSYKFALSAYVAGVAYYGQVRHAAAQLDGNVPLGQVAVKMFSVGAESAMYCAQSAYACIVDAL